MTSSLVGSEMCIRDRDRPSCSNRKGRAKPHVTRNSFGQRKDPPIPSGTVSYTHLTLPTICSV
eukprot:504609-Prorocentrum_lima.AAC.1